ncbi:MAG: Fic family protein [Eubacteriales bacterium]|nr:Fic family protein [Eubacteriales bacterium]MDD4583443.1 Fic family protein [Eubacteriales bacterium]
MFREIKKKKLILENRKPYPAEILRFINEMNTIDWIFSSLRLDGFYLSKTSIERIIRGDFMVDVSVSDHATIGNYQEAIKLLYDMSDLGVYLNEKYLLKVYQTLIKPAVSGYRKSNPILRMLNYNPPHFKEVEEQMDLFFHWFHSNVHQSNPLEKAAYLHNKLVEIYPFEQGSEAIARMAAQYHLICNGFPPILWNINEQEYYDAIRLYLKKEEIKPIYDVLERGVYNKLEIMMQLTVI